MTMIRSIISSLSVPHVRNFVHEDVVQGEDLTSLAAIPGILMDIDATQSDSYSGSGQPILNKLGDADFDCYLGSDSSVEATIDPVFNGAAGNSAAFFDLPTSGFGHFSNQIASDTGISSQPAPILDFHKSTEGLKGWLGIAINTGTWINGKNALWGTRFHNNMVGNHGSSLEYDHANEEITFYIENNLAAGVPFVWKWRLESDTDYFIVLTLSHTGGNTTATLFINSINGYPLTEAVSTTTDANGAFKIMNSSSSVELNDDTRKFYWAGFGNAEIIGTDITDIQTALFARHARTYIDDAADGADPLASVADIGLAGHISAALPSSWSGGQKLFNVVTSPSVGAQSDFDFDYGIDDTVDVNEPIFVGTIGSRSAGFKWVDEDESLRQSEALGLSIKSHRSDLAGYWTAVVFRTPAGPMGNENLYSSQKTGSGGVRIRYGTDQKFDLQVFDGSSFVTAANITGVIAGNTDHLLIVSWDGSSTTNNVKTWLNTITATTTKSLTFGANTSDSTTKTALGNVPDANSAIDVGTIIRDCSIGNVFLDDAKVANIVAAYETLYGLDFTP